MAVFWFCSGVLTTLLLMGAALPWLRTRSWFAALGTLSGLQRMVALAVLGAALGGTLWLAGTAATAPRTAAVSVNAGSDAVASTAAASGVAAESGGFAAAARVFESSTSQTPRGVAPSPAAAPPASSMDTAIANLEARLARGSGSAADWELLAKSFEFVGRPADAAAARAGHLPSAAPPDHVTASPEQAAAAAPAVAVTGEVMLDAALSGKVSGGDTVFIVAKSVDSPGAPVAVLRARVGAWPLRFTLDDSLAMMPGRSLSSAGHVTIEARISRKGQPFPAAGDLQGSSGPVDPAAHAALKILIDKVIT